MTSASHTHVWRKSSRSAEGDDGKCVEVARGGFRKSSRSVVKDDGDCVETTKCNCGEGLLFQDSKLPGPLLHFSLDEARKFIAAVKASKLDRVAA